MGDPQGTPGDEPLLFCLLTTKTHQDTSCLLHVPPREMPRTPASTFQHSCWYLPPICVHASTDIRSCASSAGVFCDEVMPHYQLPFTLASLHSRVNWHTHCTCEAFGCFCAPKPRLKPKPSPSPDGLGPKARASISVSLSPPKPGLSRGFQAEPGPHITTSDFGLR